MRIERRIKFEGPRLARKIPQSEQQPVGAPHFSDVQFIAGDIEWRPVPTIRRFDLYQSRLFVRGETGDVVARPVTVLNRHPTHSLRQIAATGGRQCGALMFQYELLTCPPQSPIALVSACDIEFTGDVQHLFELFRRRLVALRWWGANPKLSRFLKSHCDMPVSGGIQPGWVDVKPSHNGIHQRRLEVEGWLVANDPVFAEPLEHRANVLVLELD